MKNLFLSLSIASSLFFSAQMAYSADASTLGGASALVALYSIIKSESGGEAMSSEIGGTSTTKGTIRLKVINAKEDAATFLATDGSVRGVALESALSAIREANPSLQYSDMELAQSIVVAE